MRIPCAPNAISSTSKELEAFGSLNATTKVPRAFPLKLKTGADCTDWMPRSRYTRRHPASKRVSVERFGHVTGFPSHTACAHVPTYGGVIGLGGSLLTNESGRLGKTALSNVADAPSMIAPPTMAPG